ncbi:MAG: helix-turn-helix domain-containing protein [Parvularculales bacterium]
MMRAAERLFARDGPENVTTRAIVEASGQKNESALQYHFGSRQGLIREIHNYWGEKIAKKRAAIITEMSTPAPLRDIVVMMFTPGFTLATEDPDYRCYVKAFGQETVLSALPAITRVPAPEGANRLVEVLRKTLPHLSDDNLNQRIDWAIRLAAISMAQLANRKNAFRGEEARLAYHRTIDAMVGILGADVSGETQEPERQ